MSDYFITPFVSAQENNPKELQNVGLWHYPCWKLRAARERPHRLNILLIGAPGVGKSTFINTLFNSEIIPSERNRTADDFQTAIFCGALGEGGITLEVEVIELLGYNSAARLSNQKYSQQILQLFQDRFQCCYEAENSFPRDLKTALNQAINAIIYFVPPTFTQFTTDEIALFRELQQAALLIPVIAKADMYTEEELKDRKLLIRAQFEANNLPMIPNILQGLTDAHLVEDLEEILANWPLAIVASTQTHLINDEVIRSRQYPWGTVDVDNAQHSDLHLAERLLVASFYALNKEHIRHELYERVWRPQFKQAGIGLDVKKVQIAHRFESSSITPMMMKLPVSPITSMDPLPTLIQSNIRSRASLPRVEIEELQSLPESPNEENGSSSFKASLNFFETRTSAH